MIDDRRRIKGEPFELEPGDIIVSKRDPTLKRIIVEARATGYEWKYPYSDKTFCSENSNDEFFFWEWLKEDTQEEVV